MHGGSWVSGDADNFRSPPDLIRWWLEHDYAVAVVEFRRATRPGRSPEVKPRDQARDIAHALSWLQSSEDAQQAVAFGFSSGAHLVARLGADPHLFGATEE